MRKPSYNNETFIQRAKYIYNNFYTYDKCNFSRTAENIIATCPIHGDFSINANNHMRGYGCSKCSRENNISKKKFTKEQIVKRATDIWGDRFDYSEMEYTLILNKHRIKCNLCGDYFEQDLNNHINYKKNGCPNCQNERGWSRSQWINFCNKKKNPEPKIYIIRLFNDSENFIKIGMTSNSIHSRASKIPYEYEVLKEINGSALFVYDKEVELHKLFVRDRYIPQKYFKGMFECFSIDILKDI